MKSDEPIFIQFRQYFHKEIPALIGIKKWNLNRELRPHRKALGKRDGNRWRYDQVVMILQIFGVPYQLE